MTRSPLRDRAGDSFRPDPDTDELRAVVRDFLDKHSTEADVRRLMAGPQRHDPAVWRQAARDLGLHGLVVPERLGGSGADPVQLGAAFEAMGAALYCAPFFATVALATTALLEMGSADAQARHLPALADGSATATLAWDGADPAAGTIHAEQLNAGAAALTGTARTVVDGADTDLLLVLARAAPGLQLYAVTGSDRGVRRDRLTALDETRALADVIFDGAPAELVGDAAAVAGGLARTFDLAALYLAAEQLGGAARVLDSAVDYARTRVQFGRPIGSFQAVKHRCAGMLIDVESARSVVQYGLWAATNSAGDLPVAAALARSVTSDAFQRVAAANIQIHGGIGFTWEHPAHLYLKRAKSSQSLLDTPHACRMRLAGLLGVTADVDPRADDGGPLTTESPGELDGILDGFLDAHPVPDPAERAADREFRGARFDAGLAVVGFDVGHGGRHAAPSLQAAVEGRFLAAGAADHSGRNVIGLGMAMPTIHEHGTPEQRASYLRPCFTGEQIWCQLFSEPGAGSDLASLATRAVREGDEFVINGQKLWTSLAHVASRAILLARTDPAAPKHRGLTFFLLDMRSPGVEVRPLRQLTGEAEFNEVYLTDVRVPVADVLGGVGNGWAVAMTTLANERVSLGGRARGRGEGPIGQAVREYRAASLDGRVDASHTEALMQLWTRDEAARLTNLRAAQQSGPAPGPAGSIAKLQMAELNQAVYELCVDLAGRDGLLVDGYDLVVPDEAAVHGGVDVRKAYLRSLANSIEGGTSEILRTVLGERVLGLPAEPRVDRDQPWNATRRA